MRRRAFLKEMAGGALAVAACAGLDVMAEESQPPNIILIMADDLGYGDLGCYGSDSIRTPNLDALAAGGLRFTDYHSNGVVCSPTRAALMTGRYQQRCGVEGVITAKSHRHTGMPLAETTIAELLKDAGYATALFGKWHLGYQAQFGPIRQGFDTFRGFVSGNVDYHAHIDQAGYVDWWKDGVLEAETGYATDLIAQHALQFVEANQARPFFLYLPHGAPHSPYQGREDAPLRSAGFKGPLSKGRPEAYGEMIEVMDEGVGAIVERLETLGLTENTLVIFCSDNGAAALGSNGALRGGKGTVWEGGHRVPAIASWPGHIAPGSKTDATAMGMDFFPTFAALAGATAPAERALDGVDLSGLLFQGEGLPARDLFWKYGEAKAMRRGMWKFVAEKRGGGLYNLAGDLGEENDLKENEGERFAAMERAFGTWYKSVCAKF